jgi:molybdenum cofactor cytidylyltransferase
MGAAVDGVLLAGGCSCRAGVFKMTARVGGRPLLLWGLESLAAVCSRVIVVAGSGAGQVEELVTGLQGVELVVNGNFAAGMLSSVQAGARQVRAPRFFLLPGDMPLVRASVLRRLLAAGQDADIIVPACMGRRGHPVLLPATLIPDIIAEPPGSNLGNIIRRRGSVVVEVDDPGVLADLDTPSDRERIDAALRARRDQ